MQLTKVRALSNGLATFSMFFGAGNIIFPLMIGQAIGGNLIYALLGLIVTAILIPFSGLISITLFEGDYFKFFYRMGKIPGFLIILSILGLIGPFGGIPRCVTLTYSTMKVYFPHIKLMWFSLGACFLIFFCSYKRHRIIDVLGLFLTPMLLLFLVIIIIKAIFFSHPSPSYVMAKGPAFAYGLKEGYNTMDLLAAFFFSSVICSRLKENTKRGIVKDSLKASSLGAILLALVYLGFSFAASYYRMDLQAIPPDQLLGVLGHTLLGPGAGFIISMAVLLSCLTTAIALSVVCSEFLQKKLLVGKVRYEWCLMLILFATLLVSTLEFSGIVKVLAPVIQVCYPSLLMLSFLNILYKLWGFETIKIPVYTVFILMIFSRFL